MKSVCYDDMTSFQFVYCCLLLLYSRSNAMDVKIDDKFREWDISFYFCSFRSSSFTIYSNHTHSIVFWVGHAISLCFFSFSTPNIGFHWNSMHTAKYLNIFNGLHTNRKLEIKMKIRNEYGQSCGTVWTEYKKNERNRNILFLWSVIFLQCYGSL